MKRFNNKILIIILAVLVAAFVLTRLFRSPARETNLDVSTLSIDTASIDQVKILPAIDNRKEIRLMKEGNAWKVTREQVTAAADKNRIRTLLGKLASMKPERIVTRKKEKWNDYQVSDTTGTAVIALAKNAEVARFTIGKDQMNVTFVRKDDDEEVYAVAGANASSFNQKFDDWRDQTFLRIDIDKISKITFTYPADSSFVLSKKEKSWTVNNMPADSVKTESYLNKLRLKEIENFADNFSASSPPEVTLVIEAEKPITIKGWRSSTPHWVLTSDLQPGVYFSDEKNLVTKDIFWGSKQFLK